MSSPSGSDTAVRGVVMLAVLGGGVWGALQYPPVCGRAKELLARWDAGTLLQAQDDVAQVRLAGGDAPPFVAAPGTEEPPAPLRFDDTTHPLAAPPQGAGGLYPAQQVDYRRNADPAVSSAGDCPDFCRQHAKPGDFVPPAKMGLSPSLHLAPSALADLETQLGRLGARYCLLERWEENPPRFRFHCRVQLSTGTEPRRFEASGADPARLVREVADAVEAAREVAAPLPPPPSAATH